MVLDSESPSLTPNSEISVLEMVFGSMTSFYSTRTARHELSQALRVSLQDDDSSHDTLFRHGVWRFFCIGSRLIRMGEPVESGKAYGAL